MIGRVGSNTIIEQLVRTMEELEMGNTSHDRSKISHEQSTFFLDSDNSRF